MININDIIINLLCLKKGIVPFAGTAIGHIPDSLSSLTPEARKKSTRKFRKYLKRAVHQRASRQGPPGSSGYEWYKGFICQQAGLHRQVKNSQSAPTSEESSYRLKLVKEYLSNNIKLNAELNI